MNIYIFITLLFITEYSISQLSQDSNQFERKYITGYDWNNVTLTLYSNNTYQLTSLWNVDMNEDEISKNSLIIWSSGKYNDSNETIICTNFIDLRKLILSKNSSSDIFKIVDSTDFHVLSNENNFHKGWEYKNDSIMFIGSLLDEDTLFYIHSESLSKKNEHDFKYILYRWENGEKGLFIKSPQIKMITSTNFHGENNLKLVVYIPYINVIPPNNYYFLLDRIVVSHIMS